MKIIDESERLKGEMVGVSLEEEEGIRKRKGVVNNLAEQETSRLLNLSRWIGHHHQSAQAGLIIIAVRLNPVNQASDRGRGVEDKPVRNEPRRVGRERSGNNPVVQKEAAGLAYFEKCISFFFSWAGQQLVVMNRMERISADLSFIRPNIPHTVSQYNLRKQQKYKKQCQHKRNYSEHCLPIQF